MLRLHTRFQPRFSKPDDGGEDPPAPEKRPTDPGERLDPERLKAQHGDAERALRHLAFKLDEVERDNAALRTKVREGRLPDGAVVLQGEDVAAYEALKALGTADDLRARLAQAEADAAFRAEKEREAEFARVAEAAGVNLAALQAAKGADALAYEIEGDGDDRKVYVKPPDAEERVEFSEYVEATWPALKAALYETASAPPDTKPAPRVGRPFVVQRSGPPPSPKVPDAAQIAQQKARAPEYAAAI